ncbi:cellulose synthase, partial [Pluralibacter gergoviae]
MTRLTALLLPAEVAQSLRLRYDAGRQRRASWFSALCGCLWVLLAWLFLPLERGPWQRVRSHHRALYPHIDPRRPRPLDPLRYLIQSLWLIAVRQTQNGWLISPRAVKRVGEIMARYHGWLDLLPGRVSGKIAQREGRSLEDVSPGLRRVLLGIVVGGSLLLALLCVTQPFNPLSQFIFLLLLWGVALLVRRIPGRFSILMLIVLSLTVSCRYIWWRYTATLNWDDPVSLTCGLILLVAETYAWVVLVFGYFQVVWPLNRKPAPLPESTEEWPSVDIFIPTYNEELSVVKNTVYASLGLDWPKEKLTIWILDDGGRAAFREFAREVGVEY